MRIVMFGTGQAHNAPKWQLRGKWSSSLCPDGDTHQMTHKIIECIKSSVTRAPSFSALFTPRSQLLPSFARDVLRISCVPGFLFSQHFYVFLVRCFAKDNNHCKCVTVPEQEKKQRIDFKAPKAMNLFNIHNIVKKKNFNPILRRKHIHAYKAQTQADRRIYFGDGQSGKA